KSSVTALASAAIDVAAGGEASGLRSLRSISRTRPAVITAVCLRIRASPLWSAEIAVNEPVSRAVDAFVARRLARGIPGTTPQSLLRNTLAIRAQREGPTRRWSAVLAERRGEDRRASRRASA